MASIRDIAAAANVTPGTVSKVLNGRESSVRISESTARRIREKAEELGYKPNRLARALSMGRTMQIALWVPNLIEPYYTEMLHFVNTSLRVSGYDMLVADTPHDDDWKQRLCKLSDLSVDGILACDCPVYVSGYLDSMGTQAKPLVSFGASIAKRDDVDKVILDIDSGFIASLDHLSEKGSKMITYVTPEKSAADFDSRYMMYLSYCQENSLTPQVVKADDYTPASAYRCVKEFLQGGSLTHGILCFNDDVAFGAYRAIVESGLSIPDDVALVGHNGIRDCLYMSPRLSTVYHPRQQMCEVAWKLLLNRISGSIEDHLVRQSETMYTEFIIDESSRRV